MSKKGLAGELGLVLQLDPVPCLVVSHCMLQDHDFEHFLGMGVSEFTLGDEGTDMGRQSMNTLNREPADIRQKLFLEVPEMLPRVHCITNGIKSKPGHLLTLQGDGPIVYEGLEAFLSLPSNILWSCFQPVLQSSASSVSMQGLQGSQWPCIDYFPVLRLMGRVEIE